VSDLPEIRRASPGDAIGLARVHVAAWRDTYAGVLPSRYLIEMSSDDHAGRWRRFLSRHNRNHGTFVAEDPYDGIVGYGSCGPNRSPDLAGVAGEVHALYVDPMAQGQGLGRQLMAAMTDDLLTRRHRSLCVWVLTDNPARWFYAHMGGRLAAEEAIRFAGADLRQLAYIWPDLPSLLRLAGSVGDPA
jgi:GNAT superfamily N-acetyltransferase